MKPLFRSTAIQWIARARLRPTDDLLDELEQVGRISLLKTVKRYDAKHRATFETYATW